MTRRRAWMAQPTMAIACLLVALATPAHAQAPERPARPFRGLFGGAQQTDPARSQSLDLALSFFGGYDDSLLAGREGASGNVPDPRYSQAGGLANAVADLSYVKVRRENRLEAGARAAFRYYPSASELNAADYGANTAFSVRPSPRLQVGGSGDLYYQPFFAVSAIPVFGPAAGQGPAMSVGYGLAARRSLGYGAAADAVYDAGRRTHLTAGYSFRGFDFLGAADDGRMRQHGARAGLTRDVTRYAAIGGRYVYDAGESAYFGPASESRSHAGEATFDYSRTLRSRRQVSVGLSAGYGRLQWVSGRDGQPFEHQVTGSAHAALDLGRTWTARGDYRRGLRYLPGVAEPIFSDDVQAAAWGLVSRRVDLSVGLQYSNGVGNFSAASGFTSAGGQAQLRWAISRVAAATWSYGFYRYEYPPGVPLPPGYYRTFNRHALRVGVDLWLPLVR